MKKYNIIIILIPLMSINLSAQSIKKIKRTETKIFRAQFQQGQPSKKDIQQTTIVDFDSLGRTAQLIDETPANRLVTAYFYDSLGNQIRQNITLGNGKLFKTRTKTYDLQGNLINETSNFDNRTEFFITYTYDNMRRRTEYSYYNDRGKRDTRISYNYDAAGNLVATVEYDTEDKVRRQTTFRYDTANQLVETQLFGNVSNLLQQNRYQKGQIVEVINFTGGMAENNRTTYQYDNLGNVTESVFYDARCIPSTFIQKFSIQKELDKNGNWTKITQKNNEKIGTITERMITYF